MLSGCADKTQARRTRPSGAPRRHWRRSPLGRAGAARRAAGSCCPRPAGRVRDCPTTRGTQLGGARTSLLCVGLINTRCAHAPPRAARHWPVRTPPSKTVRALTEPPVQQHEPAAARLETFHVAHSASRLSVRASASRSRGLSHAQTRTHTHTSHTGAPRAPELGRAQMAAEAQHPKGADEDATVSCIDG